MKIVLIKHFYVSGGPRLRHVHVPDIMHNILKLMIVKSSQEILQTRKFLSRYNVKEKSTLQRMNFLSRKSKFLSRMIILKFIQFKFIVEFNYMRIVISDSQTLETLYFLYSFLKQETLILCCFKVKYSTMVFKSTLLFSTVYLAAAGCGNLGCGLMWLWGCGGFLFVDWSSWDTLNIPDWLRTGCGTLCGCCVLCVLLSRDWSCLAPSSTTAQIVTVNEKNSSTNSTMNTKPISVHCSWRFVTTPVYKLSAMLALQHMDEMQIPAVIMLKALLDDPIIVPAEEELSSRAAEIKMLLLSDEYITQPFKLSRFVIE